MANENSRDPTIPKPQSIPLEERRQRQLKAQQKESVFKKNVPKR